MTPEKTRYHHGDLRRALLDAALDILAEEGIDGLSLRGIARRAGVSQAAPYSHFRNRRALLAGVAQVGFERLSRAMNKATAGKAESDEYLVALGVAYVRFALNNPHLYALMFSGEVRGKDGFDGLAETAAGSYAIIDGSVASHLGLQEADSGTLAAWAMVHGIADLALHGRIALPRSAAAQRKYVEGILRHLF